jgi:hypothetical protein
VSSKHRFRLLHYRDTGLGWFARNVVSVQKCCEFWKMGFIEELGTRNLMTARVTSLYYEPLSLCTRGFVWIKFATRLGYRGLRRETNS